MSLALHIAAMLPATLIGAAVAGEDCGLSCKCSGLRAAWHRVRSGLVNIGALVLLVLGAGLLVGAAAAFLWGLFGLFGASK